MMFGSHSSNIDIIALMLTIVPIPISKAQSQSFQVDISALHHFQRRLLVEGQLLMPILV
jgi:hypothetical protein